MKSTAIEVVTFCAIILSLLSAYGAISILERSKKYLRGRVSLEQFEKIEASYNKLERIEWMQVCTLGVFLLVVSPLAIFSLVANNEIWGSRVSLALKVGLLLGITVNAWGFTAVRKLIRTK